MQFTGVFAHNVVLVQYDAAGFVGHVVLSGSQRWLVLRLLPLPCHAVCHTFVLVRAALDRTFMRRIQRCQLFSFASVFCQSSFCND